MTITNGKIKNQIVEKISTFSKCISDVLSASDNPSKWFVTLLTFPDFP